MARGKRKNKYVSIKEYLDLDQKQPQEISNQLKNILKDDILFMEIYNVKARLKPGDPLEANLELFGLSDNVCVLIGVFTTQITREEANWILDGEDPELSSKNLYFALKSIPEEFIKEDLIKK